MGKFASFSSPFREAILAQKIKRNTYLFLCYDGRHWLHIVAINLKLGVKMSKKIEQNKHVKSRERDGANPSSIIATIRLTPAENEAALKAGDGNRSEGLRVALAHYAQKRGTA